MRRAGSALGWALALAVGAARPADNLLPPGAGFEVGAAGFHLFVRDEATARPSFEEHAGEGRRSLRLRAAASEGAAAVQWPWLRLEPGRTYTLSAFLRTDRPGLAAVFALVSADGPEQSAPVRVTRDWRRYAVGFTLPSGGSGYARVEIRTGRGGDGFEAGSIWLDGVRLARGDDADWVPAPAIGVEIAGGGRLRRAGDRVDFRIRLRAPGLAGRISVRWRLEDPHGVPVRRGVVRTDELRDERAEAGVRITSLAPGAWRFVAEAELSGETLVEDATVVAATMELGLPEKWLGLSGDPDDQDSAVWELLRVGLHRGIVPPGDDPPSSRWRVLHEHRRAGIGCFGFLPPPAGEPDAYRGAVAARVGSYRGLVKVWELPPEVTELDTVFQRAAFEGLKQADRGTLLIGLRLPAEDALSRLQAAADQGALDWTDAIQLVLGADPPEKAGGIGLANLIEAVRAATAARGRPLPVGVLATGWVAEPWDRTMPGVPVGPAAQQRVSALEQASFLARAMLLARAAGAGCLLYDGPPSSRDPSRRSVADAGATTALHAFDGTPLPVVAALDRVLDQLRGRRLGEEVPLASGAACLRWEGRRPLATVWQWRAPSGDVRLHLPPAAAALVATNLFGLRVPLAMAADGPSLALGQHPIFLEPGGLSAEDFARILRAARLDGLSPIEATVVPIKGGVGVRVANTSNHPVDGDVIAAGETRMLGAIVPGTAVTIELPQSAGDEREWRVEAIVRVGGETIELRRRVPLWIAPREEAAWTTRWALHNGVAVEPDDLAARVAVDWDEAALRVRFDVTDDALAAGDAVEVLLCPELSGAAGVRRVESRVNERTVAGVPGATAAIVPREGGYEVTVRLPWRELGIAPASGLAIGFDVGVQDDDGAGVETHLRWRGAADTDRDPTAMGWLILR